MLNEIGRAMRAWIQQRIHKHQLH